MAENPYVNKVEYAGQTLMDLTGDTVTPSDVLSGITFHDRSGAPQTGNLITHNVYDGLDSTSASDALSAKQGKVLNDNIAPLLGNTKWTDWETVSSYTNGESWNGSNYTKIGKITYIRISVKGLTANTMTEIFTLPSGYRPLMAIEFDGFGGLAYLNHAHFVISDTGAVRVYSADTYATGFIVFPSV